MGLFDSVLKGAAGGTAVAPGIGTIAGAGISLVPEIFKFFSGSKQIKQANAINPVNPGFVANNSLIDNARILEDRYRNYTMPGYSQAKTNIETTAANTLNTGIEGATSSSDVLDLASKVNYGTGQSLNNLATTNAVGANEALNQYLNASATAGNEAVRKNMFDLDQYNQKLAEKAALLQAGNQNKFSAGDALADGIRYFTQPQQQIVQPTANTSGFKLQKSIFA